jgi:rhodanese-related sulfurtransferase
MAVKHVSPEEALELMRGAGYSYIDVRSVPEFAQGHPAGAYNVPLVHMGPAGNQANPRFLEVVEKHFAKDAPLVVGCRTSGRSEHAARVLEQAGFTKLLVQGSGFVGASPIDPGWAPKGLPTSLEAAAGRSWGELAREGE